MKSLETKKTVRVNTKKNYINHLLVNVQSHFVRYSSRYSFLLNLLGKAVFILDGTSININNNRNTDGVKFE